MLSHVFTQLKGGVHTHISISKVISRLWQLWKLLQHFLCMDLPPAMAVPRSGGSLTGPLTLATISTSPRTGTELCWPDPHCRQWEETVAPAEGVPRNVLCAGLHSEDQPGRENHLPLPHHHQLLLHHTQLKITNGSRLGKAQSCLRLDAQFPVPHKVQSSSSYTNIALSSVSGSIFNSCSISAHMTHEGN